MRILLTLLALLSFYLGHSNHLLGGYIAYKHIAGTTYQVQLTLYRDCNSTTPFDGAVGSASPFASVGIFSGTDLIEERRLTNPAVAYVQGDTALPCTTAGQVCREIGVYTDTITLPSANVNYTLIYERCCLPGNVNNVVEPYNQGSMFTATIPANSNNNSPSINLNLARYIRLHQTTSIANWCTDVDGDSLAFKLSTPLSAGSNTMPAPTPPMGPPYSPVSYSAGYSATQPFGQASTCSVNSAFGQIQIVPQGIGVFLMNISVSEYRNSTLLAEYPILLTFSVLDCNADTSIVIPVDTNATSIDDMYSDTYIALYPNPASDAVSIQYNGTAQHAYLYDIKGMKLQEVELGNGQALLKQLSAYAPGIYYVQIGKLTKRLVIARR